MKVIQLQNNTAVLSDTQFDMYLKIKSFYEERNVEQMLSSQLRRKLDIGSTNFNYLLIVLMENGLIVRPERGVIKLTNLNKKIYDLSYYSGMKQKKHNRIFVKRI